jgi:hypothetical protein
MVLAGPCLAPASAGAGGCPVVALLIRRHMLTLPSPLLCGVPGGKVSPPCICHRLLPWGDNDPCPPPLPGVISPLCYGNASAIPEVNV